MTQICNGALLFLSPAGSPLGGERGAEQPGGGTGRALLSSAVAAAAERDCTELRLEVREDNPRAIALYERNGFVATGRRPGYYADGATAIRYARPIAGTAQATRPQARDARTGKRTPS